MASTTSNDGRDSERLADGLPVAPAPPRRNNPPPNEVDEDANALDEGTIRINPEILRGVPPLHGLNKVEVVILQPAPTWARWTEELTIHLIGSGIVAAIAFTVGLMFAGPTLKAESPQPTSSCAVAPVPDIKDRNG
ncbi:MAG: hypothetical protein WAM62_14855 [Pseudolabrys sp.]